MISTKRSINIHSFIKLKQLPKHNFSQKFENKKYSVKTQQPILNIHFESSLKRIFYSYVIKVTSKNVLEIAVWKYYVLM